MLGLLLIYFIGKFFYELAQDYNKHRWLYAILGIIIYYVSGFIFGIILFVVGGFIGLGINWEGYGINLLALPVGILADYGFYKYLESKWKKAETISANEIDDIGKDITQAKN